MGAVIMESIESRIQEKLYSYYYNHGYEAKFILLGFKEYEELISSLKYIFIYERKEREEKYMGHTLYKVITDNFLEVCG
jgi:hypothetical protein